MGGFFTQMTERRGRALIAQEIETTIFFKGIIEETHEFYNIKGIQEINLPREIFKKKNKDSRGRIVGLVLNYSYVVDEKTVVLGTRGKKEKERCILIRRRNDITAEAMSPDTTLVLIKDIKRIELTSVVKF